MMQRNDKEELRKLMHTLAGVLGNIGAMNLHQATLELSHAYKTTEATDSLIPESRRIVKEVVQLSKQIQAVLNPGQVPQPNLPAMATSDLQQLMYQLQVLIEAHDLSAIEILEEAMQRYSFLENQGNMHGILNSLNQMDFDVAASQLKEMG